MCVQFWCPLPCNYLAASMHYCMAANTISPAYTSLRCSECGYTDKKNRESQALFHCLSCGSIRITQT
ncbi:zinc ribbon domain-containing protein [Ferrimicrobium acidiphilum]|uniref:zinc ribbon domain-containing protein n=1 Tax=Ferrimicrobium acidiphilum TaxID=121039 RepID=UPI0009E0188B